MSLQGTIVVADRSRTVRRMVEIALGRQSLKLEFAGDAQSAINAVKSGNASLALVDPSLPGDGYEAAKGIKAASGSTKVLMLVGRNHGFDAGKARNAGSDGHVSKPFITQDLIRAVADVLGQPEPDAALFKASTASIPLARGGTSNSAPSAPPPSAARKQTSAPPRAPTKPKSPAPPPLKKAAPPPAAAARKPSPPPPSRPSVDAAVQAAASKVANDPNLGQALSGASREVIEQIAWEVIPKLAEAILKEEIARVVRERMAAS